MSGSSDLSDLRRDYDRGALTREDLEARDDKKGQVWFATIRKPGRPAEAVVAEAVEHAVRNFPWPKSMRWGAGSLRWVRPLHSILCVLTDEAGSEIVPFEIDGIVSGDTTEGHRFMAPGRFSVTNFEDYAAKLKRAKVILSADQRAEHEAQRAGRVEAAQRGRADLGAGQVGGHHQRWHEHHGRQHAERHPGTDAIDLEQRAKQRPLVRRREAVQNLGVLAHQQMRMQEDVGPDFRQVEKCRHRCLDLIADAAALDDDMRRMLGSQPTVQRTDHRSPAIRFAVPSRARRRR